MLPPQEAQRCLAILATSAMTACIAAVFVPSAAGLNSRPSSPPTSSSFNIYAPLIPKTLLPHCSSPRLCQKVERTKRDQLNHANLRTPPPINTSPRIQHHVAVHRTQDTNHGPIPAAHWTVRHEPFQLVVMPLVPYTDHILTEPSCPGTLTASGSRASTRRSSMSSTPPPRRSSAKSTKLPRRMSTSPLPLLAGHSRDHGRRSHPTRGAACC